MNLLIRLLILANIQICVQTSKVNRNEQQARLFVQKRKPTYNHTSSMNLAKEKYFSSPTDTRRISTKATELPDDGRLLALASDTRSENAVSIGLELSNSFTKERGEKPWIKRVAIFSSKDNDIIYSANVPPSKKIYTGKELPNLTPFYELKKKLIEYTRNKIVTGIGLRSVASFFQIYFKYWQIRELSCLKKFHNCLKFNWCLRPNNYVFTGYSVAEPLTFFTDANANKFKRFYTAEENAEFSMEIYRKFSEEWENEMEVVFQNMTEEKIEEKIRSLPTFNPPADTNEKVFVHTGFHCDMENYSLKNFDYYFANFYYSFYVDFYKNLPSRVSVTKFSGITEHDEVIPFNEGPIRSTVMDRIARVINGILGGHGKNYVIGYNIKEHLKAFLGDKVSEIEGRIFDVRDLIEKYENGNRNLSLKSYAEIYLHITFAKEPVSLYLSKICMQLFKLFRFDIKLWPNTYKQMWIKHTAKPLPQIVNDLIEKLQTIITLLIIHILKPLFIF